ncbi:hypothetical protein CRYUN_Cryun07bG0143600 [Craigia yunnanensis]
MASSIFKGHGSHHNHGQTTECCSQTETLYTDHGLEKPDPVLIQPNPRASPTPHHVPHEPESVHEPD